MPASFRLSSLNLAASAANPPRFRRGGSSDGVQCSYVAAPNAFVIRQGIEKACMPSFSGVERDLEAKTTVCIDGLFRKIMRGNYNGPAEVAVAIDCAKLLVCL